VNYYNEINPHAAQWLRNLIAAGHIANGDVDERSIEDVRPADLRGYAQCHFFAGIGGWAYALDLAGWPRDRPVWTGSCPCQPFSKAGKGAGFEDERHLWPAWQHLIAQCRPSIVIGEQVASDDADDWLDLVQADLEGMGYAVGGVAFPAASIGAPQIRQRIYWMGDADDTRSQGHGEPGWEHDAHGWADAARHPATNGLVEWIADRTGRVRPVEPGTRPLANGVSGRVGRLRAYGNAIVPQQAAAFVRSYMTRDVRLEAAA
jgi:DNA (cytosine-5)-methyltransferase 1